MTRMWGVLSFAAAALLLLGAPGLARAQEPAAAQEPAPAQEPARAQDQAPGREAGDTLRARYRLPQPPAPVLAPVHRVAPSTSAGSPTAFGPAWGQGFVGMAFEERARHRQSRDGAVAAGFGLGDPRSLVGAEVAVTSYSTIHTGFFRRTGVSFKVHRVFPGNIGVAAGVENALITTDQAGRDEPRSFYLVASQVISVHDDPLMSFMSLTASVGIGTGRFRSEQRIINDNGGVGFFASLGVRLLEPLAVLIDFTGQDLALGASITPLPGLPLVVTPAVTDVTGSAGDGARFILGAGAGFNFAQLRDALPLFGER